MKTPLIKYLSAIIHYQLNRNKISNNRLVLGMIVRDEQDIIELNIKIHAFLGVDAFIVYDHCSHDNTYAILEQLAKKFDILLIKKTDRIYRQEQWSTEIVHMAKKKLGADWVIVSDADEFWIPDESNNLKDYMYGNYFCIKASRYNVVPEREKIKTNSFKDFDYVVFNPINYINELDCEHFALKEILESTPGKIAVRPEGFITMRAGSHTAWIKGKKKSAFFEQLKIYHYPIRNEKQFLNRTTNRIDSLKYKDQGVKISRLEENKVKHLIEDPVDFKKNIINLCPSKELLGQLEKLGIAARQSRLKEVITKAEQL